MLYTPSLHRQKILRPDPGRLDELRRIRQAHPRTAQEAVIDEERAGIVGGMGETILMITLERTVNKANVIRYQLQVAPDRRSDGRQAAEIPVDGEALQRDGVRPKIFPEAGTPGRIHLGINPDPDLELGKTTFDQF